MVAPLNYFLHAAGPAARPTMLLGWAYSAVVTLVCLIIIALLLIAILRKRPAEKFLTLSRETGGLRWIYIGTVLSVVVLFAMMVEALVTLNTVATPLTAPALTLTVTGYDWWWKVEYADTGIITANEIHIPVGVPVLVKLNSADVIHAFWAPLLAGKTEMIPGLTNRQWIEADAPGIYHGKCTQFCGAQHAHMDFEVVAQSAEDFRRWEESQRKPAPPVKGIAKAGQAVFMKSCAACHSVKGTNAKGEHGPDLTHLQTRRLIAAGLLTNTPEHLMQWVEHPQALKPGAQMPDTALTPQESAALSAYLATLK